MELVNAMIEYRLAPEEIIQLPARLKALNHPVLSEPWMWENDDTDAEWIMESWDLPADFFTEGSGSIEDFVMLVKEELSIWFVTPGLVLFDAGISWEAYQTSTSRQQVFNQLAQIVYVLVNGSDMVAVPDLSTIPLLDEEKGMTVEAFRKKAADQALPILEVL